MKYAIGIPLVGFALGVIAIFMGERFAENHYNKTFGYRRVSPSRRDVL